MSKVNVKHGAVYFNEDFKSIKDIDARIETLKEFRSNCRVRLQMFAISTPNNIVSNNDVSDVVFNIQQQTNELLDELQQYSQDIAELEMAKRLLEAWEEKWYDDNIPALDLRKPEDLGIVIPETINYKSATFNDENPYYPKDYNNIDEYISDCITDMINQSGKVFGKYYITVGDKVIATEANEFVFQTKDDAIKSVKAHLDHMQFVKHDFVLKNPSFFDSVRNHVSDDKLEEYDKLVELIKTNDKANWKEISKLIDIMSDVITTQFLRKIRIKKL